MKIISNVDSREVFAGKWYGLALHAIRSLHKGGLVMLQLPSGAVSATLQLECWINEVVCMPVGPNKTPAEYAASKFLPELIISENSVRWPINSIERKLTNQAAVALTSGSTGSPKGTLISREAAEHNARAYIEYLGGNTKKFGTALPIHHCNAWFGSLLPAYLQAGELHIFETPFVGSEFFAFMDAQGTEIAHVVPRLLEEIIAECRENGTAPPWPSHLYALLTAAAPLHTGLASEFYNWFGNKLIQGYGMSEGVNFTTLMPYELCRPHLEEDWLHYYVNDNHIPPVGLALSEEYTLELDHETNELFFYGPNAFSCYLDDMEATAEKRRYETAVNTGDIAEINDLGMVWLKGRLKEGINLNGEIISPVAVEEEWINWLPTEANPIAFAVQDLEGNDRIGGWFEAPGTLEFITDQVSEGDFPMRLAPDVAITGRFPRTDTHKPQRLQLLNKFSPHVEHSSHYAGLLRVSEVFAQEFVNALRAEDISNSETLTWMYKAANELLLTKPEGEEVAAEAQPEQYAAVQAVYQALMQELSNLVHNSYSGEYIFKLIPDLWTRWMLEYPMGVYGSLMADFLTKIGLWGKMVMEFGAGVGNTTHRLPLHETQSFYATDVNVPLMETHAVPGRLRYLDINQAADMFPDSAFDIVFGTNALHVAINKNFSIFDLGAMVKPGGYFIFAEGQKWVNDRPWALHWLFGLLKGWRACNGFYDRDAWLRILSNAGIFEDIGYSRWRSGRYDLGGIIWARRKEI